MLKRVIKCYCKSQELATEFALSEAKIKCWYLKGHMKFLRTAKDTRSMFKNRLC